VRSSASLTSRLKNGLTPAALLLFSENSLAVVLDLRAGVTDMSQRIQNLHHMSLWVCVVVGIVVFGAMIYTIFAHRRSRHPEPAQFHENTRLEVAWTLVPTLILVGMAIPATVTLRDIEDNSESDLTVLITASQWKWHYQYLEADIGFYSRLATPQDQINNLQPKGENYLLEVDNPLVLPTNKKIRFLVTSEDVIHSWWLPDFAVKQDAIPGFINEAWTRVDQPGLHRGQCAELCGMDHAFMPIVVEVRPEAEFDSWIADQRLAMALASETAVADRNKTWTMTELFPMGQEIFLEHCATCHQPNGLGQAGKYPALAGSEITTGNIQDHLNRVLNGKADTEMQAWAPQLSDLELAAVITFERNAWGNDTGDIVQPMTVYAAR
jgi:cytochrome c oxidase subunit 2